ncbi:MAG: HAD family hydrolase [Paracoccaceae bacterium]
MWSGPRNLSTAMMRSFGARPDCAVWDEPFYAAYLARTGLDHPMGAEIIAAGETDADKVARRCAGEAPGGKRLFYQKHMTQHMVAGFPRGWMADVVNVFLIRDPEQVVASYAAKRENPDFGEIGFGLQAELFEEVAEREGVAPAVVDSADILADPRGMLTALCARIGIGFSERMLRWKQGPHPDDGVWAAHWYRSVWSSTGFAAPKHREVTLPDAELRLAERARPYYERLRAYRITA